MEPGSILQATAFVACLAISAFFSASETSLFSLSDVRVRSLKAEGRRGAAAIERATKDREKLLSALLVGNNIANTTAASLAASMAVRLFGNNGAALAISTVFVTVCILLCSEVGPKRAAAANPVAVAGFVAGGAALAKTLFTPVNLALDAATGAVFRALGISAAERPALVTEAELKTMVTVSEEEGLIREDERRMIHNVFEFDESRAKDIMTPRMDLAAIPLTAGYGACMKLFREEGFSRLPVYREDLDHIVGILHFKDFIFDCKPEAFDLPAVLRPPHFSYEGKLTSQLFMEMRQGNAQLAVILDEYGGTSGIVTLEDLVEEIVGEISDEYDEEETPVLRAEDGAFIIEGAARIDDVNEQTGLSLVSEDYETIAGYVMGLMGSVPEAGAEAEDGAAAFTVLEMDKNRIARVRVSLLNGGDGDA